MNYYHSIWIIAMLLIVLAIIQRKKRKIAAIINHRKNHKREEIKMKELAQKFIGKDCLVYTVASDSGCSVKGVIKEVTENGLLIENNGNLQAVNLEYITRIREWPRNAKGKKKTVFE